MIQTLLSKSAKLRISNVYINKTRIGFINLLKKMGGKIKIISGKFQNITGPGNPHTGMFYHDITLNKDSNFSMPLNDGWNVFIYVYEGSIVINKKVQYKNLAVLNNIGDLEIFTKNDNAKFILIGGEPLNEPVVRYGPFVTNTEGDMKQAMLDYQNGKMGTLS